VGAVEPRGEALASFDAVVIVTDHSNDDYAAIVRHSRLVADTRNARKEVREQLEDLAVLKGERTEEKAKVHRVPVPDNLT
jgi:UDP-N-acetyl-D-mannosaminuronate dehydrogenase